jgi:hypothetical protein
MARPSVASPVDGLALPLPRRVLPGSCVAAAPAAWTPAERGTVRARGRGLAGLAIRRPLGTLAIASVVVVLGLLLVGRLPIDLLPTIEYPHIRVTVNYSGAAPEVTEERITRVLERNLAATENLVRISGRASEGRTNALRRTPRQAGIAGRLQRDVGRNEVRAAQPGDERRRGEALALRPPRYRPGGCGCGRS